MAKKKKKLSPVQAYIAHCKEWAVICRETVYGKVILVDGKKVQLFNFDLDKELDYHCVGRSSTVKIKGEYAGSGIYKAYKLLAMEQKALDEIDLLCAPEVQDALDQAAKEHGYGSGQQLLVKSMNYDEKAQGLRDAIFKEYL